MPCFGYRIKAMPASLVAQTVKRLPAMRETQVQSLGWEDPLEKEMATHSSTPAWKIPWTEEPGRLQSMGSQRVGHDWLTALHFSPLVSAPPPPWTQPLCEVCSSSVTRRHLTVEAFSLCVLSLAQPPLFCQETPTHNNLREPAQHPLLLWLLRSPAFFPATRASVRALPASSWSLQLHPRAEHTSGTQQGLTAQDFPQNN